MPKAIEIVFQNEHFVAVNKPAMCLSVRSREGKDDPRPVLWDLLETQMGKKVFAVHRLDFEVSGLMLWALTNEGQSAGNSAFESSMVQKTYLAVTENPKGQLINGEWQEWKSRLLRGKKRAFESPHGKNAITKAKCLGPSKSGHLNWELNPITGRSHQLRFELAKRDFPICGDKLYGATSEFAQGIALQAIRLKIAPNQKILKLGLPDQLAVSSASQLFALTE